ncbi:MAG: aminoacyl-tRNA hydrolase [Balneolaceae bacterium]
MALIAGLGNIGDRYAGTRHNIGFDVADALADSLSLTFSEVSSLYMEATGSFKSEPVTIIKPTTFMNLSGRALSKAIAETGTPLSRCLICYDDIHLPAGTIRLRPGGSAGGHNGLQNIIDQLGNRSIPRLRMGVGNDFPRGRQAEYVLSPFTTDERIEVDKAIDLACDAILTFLRGDINLAMNQFN